jgi:hypothetical protein
MRSSRISHHGQNAPSIRRRRPLHPTRLTALSAAFTGLLAPEDGARLPHQEGLPRIQTELAFVLEASRGLLHDAELRRGGRVAAVEPGRGPRARRSAG